MDGCDSHGRSKNIELENKQQSMLLFSIIFDSIFHALIFIS